MRRLLLAAAACQLILACSSSTTGNGTSAGAGGATSGAGTGARGPASSSTGGTTTGGTSGGGKTASASTGGVADLGAACTPGNDPDPCATYGLICDIASSTCQLPGELDQCLSDVGCSSPGLVCTGGFESGGQPVRVCVYPCTDTVDCPTLITSCQNGVCFLNYCQIGDNGTINYFNPCPSASAVDGECLPVFAGGDEFAGLCVGAGSLANGQSCAGIRTDAGLAGLCQQGSNCAVFDGGMGHPSASLCEPVCYSNEEVPGDGPACSAGDLCFDFSSVYAFGNCYQSCAAGAGQTCPEGQFCDGVDSLCVPE